MRNDFNGITIRILQKGNILHSALVKFRRPLDLIAVFHFNFFTKGASVIATYADVTITLGL
jgi:hypothetical protein